MIEKEMLEQTTELTVQFEKRGGLVPTVVQEYKTGEVLILGYVNPEALERTLNTGYVNLWSTSRNQLWTKGETSGDYLKVRRILVDCDQDALIYQVEILGDGACHTRNAQDETRRSCFYRIVRDRKLEFINVMK